MDNDTQRMSGGEPARVEETKGTPTTYLPPAGSASGNGSSTTNDYKPYNSQPRTPGYAAPPHQSTMRFGSGNNIGAIILIGLGLFFLVSGGTHVFGAAIPLLIGLVFLYVYNQSRKYGYLVPGCILTGLGAGIVLEQITPFGGGIVPLGLGVGFLALWAIHRAQWWWLIPGGILALVGLDDVMSYGFPFGTGSWLPLVLIVVGGYMLLQRRQARP